MVNPSTKVMTEISPAGARARPTLPSYGLWYAVWRRFLQHRLALGGMMVLLVLTLGTLSVLSCINSQSTTLTSLYPCRDPT